MAGRRLTPIGLLAKWLLVPATLAACGFFLLGPRMGKLMPSLMRGTPAVTATPVADADAKASYAAPDVDVQRAPKMQPPEVEVSAHKARKHHKLKPVVAAAEDDNAREPVDAYTAPSHPSVPRRTIGTADGI